MTRMPDIEAEAAKAAGWIGQHLPHHHTSTAHAAAAVTIANSATQGEPVSLSTDLHKIAARLETIGEDAVGALERVQANPETAKIFEAIDELTGLNASPDVISIATAGLDELLTRLKASQAAPAQQPAGEPSFTPAGPTVAGQA